MRLYSFWITFFITRRRWRVMLPLPEEPEELFVPGQALSLLMFDRTHLLGLFLSFCADGARQVRLA